MIGYLALQLNNGELAAPFYFTIPLPIAIMYFGKYCEHKFKKASEVCYCILYDIYMI